MTNYVFHNSYQDELSAGILIGDTALLVTSVGPLTTPAATETLYLTIVDPFDHTSYEIVRCTFVAGLVLTVTRAQEGTSAIGWPAGSIVSARTTAEMLGGFPHGFDNGGNAKGAGSVNLQPSRSDDTQVAAGGGAIAIGRNTKASVTNSIAVGDDAVATGSDSIALGPGSNSGGSDSIAIGDRADATGADSIAIGDRVEARSTKQISINQGTQDIGRTASQSCYINTEKYPATKYQRHIGGYEYIAPHDWWYDGTVSESFTNQNVCQKMTFYSDPVNLGDSPAWAATTSFGHGSVIFPTVPNGKCYLCYELGASYFTSGTSGATEPTWPTSAGGSVTDGDLHWICVDPTDYQLIMPDYLRFTPTEFGFIGDVISDTTQPYISFGINGNLTKWLASTQTTLLTGDYAVEMIKPTNSEGSKQFGAGLVTAGTGNYTGRFYWEGIVTEILSA